MVESIGAIPLTLSAPQHDMAVGAISHLPHVVAYALVNSIRPQNDHDRLLQRLAAGGFRDITRIASSNPDMWESICLNNREALLALLDKFQYILSEFRNSLETKDKEAVLSFFSQAKEYRDSFDQNIRGLMPNGYVLTLDVPDKPGAIAKVSVILLSEGINIKNISISNIREYEGGVLHIMFANENERQHAKEVLIGNGFLITE